MMEENLLQHDVHQVKDYAIKLLTLLVRSEICDEKVHSQGNGLFTSGLR